MELYKTIHGVDGQIYELLFDLFVGNDIHSTSVSYEWAKRTARINVSSQLGFDLF